MRGDVLGVYAANAAKLQAKFDRLSAEDVLGGVIDHLPPAPARVLDIGAGSGRDAAWFAARGDRVTAAEPVAEFREILAARLPGAEVVDAGLPGLDGLVGPYDLILANAVWHHLAPGERAAGLARMADLLAPGGSIALALRHGPAGHDGMVHAMDADDEIARAGEAGLRLCHRGPGMAEEAGISWTWLVLESDQ
ncbi:hypothetical protein OG2516_11531 [Oceanicola granulosus HTCC2516]|uniref:Methyltransferase domain-containing protein n=1 Tax=Oceanicola granulosus (strain ATCC BAA-861 / DSM 15982 / KCTC 12143 / HTCC2516) TaxID=314256 RepID=Q2CJP7_OCEGH|nr:class I SAM-dependent methyltransferase [Oceanicola granulosus]EAR53092.1 hypothetical protein OG2516_11531 [Oceanicola granulosus HTCC2516]